MEMLNSLFSIKGARVGALAVVAFASACSAATSPGDPTPGSGGPTSNAATRAESAPAAAEDATETARVQAFLDSQYTRDDVRHTFRTRLEQDIDCVDFYAQPALKMAQLNGLQRPDHLPAPPAGLKIAPITTDLNDRSIDPNGNARICPDGSVPIVRQTVQTVRAAGGLDRLLERVGGKSAAPRLPPRPGKSSGVSGSATAGATNESSKPPNLAGYEYALGVNMALPAQSNVGGATLSVYNPFVTGAPEHSISQTWLSSAASGEAPCSAPNCVQTLEAGWNVDPGLYGDFATHLFTFSTKDGYQTTGCYNLISNCTGFGGAAAVGSGFVMLSGAPLTPGQAINYSSVGDNPVSEVYLVWYTADSGDWYLTTTGGLIGYIPGSLFANGQGGSQPLTSYASFFQAGGEVYDSNLTGSQTATEMGSGIFPGGYGQAAYQRDLIYGVDLNDGSGDSNILPANLNSYLNDSTYYEEATNVAAGGSGWDSYFYFGGPGQLQAPGGVIASALNESVSITWNPVPGATGYNVFRSTTSGGPYSYIASTVGNFGSDYFDSGLTDGTTYYYVVTASQQGVVSGNSLQVSAKPVAPPLPPTNLTEAISNRTVKLKWSASANAISYTVCRATTSGGPYSCLASVTTTSYTDASVTHGKTYYYVVNATNNSGSSPWSKQVTAKP